jgi:hypothetical protein
VTEGEWLAATDSQALLDFLRPSGGPGERRLRLFAAACCRRVWHLLADELGRKAVEMVERRADGLAGAEDRAAVDDLRLAVLRVPHDAAGVALVCAGVAAILSNPAQAAKDASALAALAWAAASGVADAGEAARQCQLLRDIFANPFRRQAPVDPAVLVRDGWAAHRLAEGAYRERPRPDGALDGDRLAVLADALEDAGCRHEDILTHLRSPGPHVRGCWAIDLLLVKR